MVGPFLLQDLERLISKGIPNLEAIEQLLQQAEERYRGFFEQSRDAMYFSSLEGRFIDFNQAMLDLLGYTRQEMLALPAVNIYDNPADRDRFMTVMAARGAVRAYEVRLKHKDGQRLICWLSSSTRKDEEGQIVGYQGLIQDITEMRSLQAERDRFFSQTRDLICTLTPDGYFKSINPAFQDTLGLTEQDILSGHFFHLLHPEDIAPAKHKLAELNRDNGGRYRGRVHFSCRHRCHNGLYKLLEWGFSPDIPGEVWYGIGTDVSEQRRNEELEREKMLAERSAAVKSDFLASMSHELRTPLNAVLGMAHLLAETHLDPVQLDYVRTLEASSASLLETINNILDFSKLDSGKLMLDEQIFEPSALVEELMLTFRFTAGQKNLDLEALLEENIPKYLYGDAFRIKQVLQNLVSNALKFTDKGHVILSIEKRDTELSSADGDSLPLPKKAGDPGQSITLLFSVSDSGIGIPQSRQQAIFDPFAQVSEGTARRYGGTGLGLAIVYRMVDLMGGQVRLQSQVGLGSRFDVLIPLSIPDQEQKKDDGAAAEQEQLPDLGARRILLVEDNRINRMVIRELLKNQWPDIQLTESESAEEAQTRLSSGNFDLVLMDVMLPGMDGRDLTRWIRERIDGAEHRLPILGLTAFASKEEQDSCLESGMDDCLSKPVRPHALYRHMARLLINPEAVRKAVMPEPEIDLSYLEMITRDNPALKKELLATMERETPEELGRLEEASAAERWDDVRAYAHRLKSTLQLIGSSALHNRLQGIERDARDRRDTGSLGEIIRQLSLEIRAALEHVRKITSSSKPS